MLLQLSKFFSFFSPPPCLPSTSVVNPHTIVNVHGSYVLSFLKPLKIETKLAMSAYLL